MKISNKSTAISNVKEGEGYLWMSVERKLTLINSVCGRISTVYPHASNIIIVTELI